MRIIMALTVPAMSACAAFAAVCFSYSINSLSERRATVTPSFVTEAALVNSLSSCSAGVVMPPMVWRLCASGNRRPALVPVTHTDH